MKPEDTVMSDEQLGEAVRGEWNAGHLRVAQAQAEISFEKGRQEGEREICQLFEQEPKRASASAIRRKKYKPKGIPIGFVDEH